MSKRVVIAEPERSAIRAAVHAAQSEEACGALLGRCDYEQNWNVSRVAVVSNEAGDRQREFLISSATVLRLEEVAAQSNTEVIGFFHSHPQGATPSPTDLARAWPGYVYLIADASNDVSLTGWTLRADRTAFEAVSVNTP